MGYSTLTVREIKEADQTLLGVQLGMICVERGIPVCDVGDYLKVSRTAVYAWFRGTSHVSYKHEDAVRELIKKLK